MAEPTRLLRKFAAGLSANLDQQERFINTIVNPARYPQALIWVKPRPHQDVFNIEKPFSWQAEFIDRVSCGQKPGSHEFHQSGKYYCLDFSSIFEVSLSNLVPESKFVIDVCASPGGKGIYLWRKFCPEKIVFNEVISKRTAPLISNIRRCGIANAEVISLDSQVLAEKYQEQADLVLVDAPCSGQSLRAKGQDAFGCFDPRIINGNAKRQKRIIANSAKMVKSGGFLLYTTCTFSLEENERVAEWLLEQRQDFKALTYEAYEGYRSDYSEVSCYRLWPFEELGAGGFCVLFQRV